MKTNNTPGQIEKRPYEVVIPTSDGSAVAYEVKVEVPMEWSAAANDWLITAEAEEIIESTKARHLGLMTPGQMVELRQRLQLTQSEIGELLCIGEKTWTRWESGRHRPSQSMNLLIRALDTGLISTYDLRWLRHPAIDWSPVLKSRVLQITLLVPNLTPPKGRMPGQPTGAIDEMNLAA